MVGIHDRRPAVSAMFTAANATTRLAPEISGEQATELARSMALGPDSFAWLMVDRVAGDVGDQEQRLAQPLPSIS